MARGKNEIRNNNNNNFRHGQNICAKVEQRWFPRSEETVLSLMITGLWEEEKVAATQISESMITHTQSFGHTALKIIVKHSETETG